MDMIVDRAYRIFRFLLDKVIGYSAILVLFLGTWLAISEVVRRYIFSTVFDWGQDAVTFGIVGAIFLYFAVTQARRSHLRMSALVDVLEKRGWVKLVLLTRTMFTILGLVTYSAISYWGISTMERSFELSRKTESMVIVIWPFQATLVLAFALLAIVCLFQLYQDIRELMGKKVFEWAPVEEGIDI